VGPNAKQTVAQSAANDRSEPEIARCRVLFGVPLSRKSHKP
jgi:hypothetical protein